ncbi:MAG: hypothetical protein Q8N22_01920 [bacterium]|nr:hypothetical protein [bacterium]
MEEFIVISWWIDPKRFNDVMPEMTTHPNLKMAWKEATRRRKFLGKEARVKITKLIKEI